MIYRNLGSTGVKVSAIGVGGCHLGLKRVDEQLAIRIVRSAVDRGINFLDNSWDYNEGVSEIRMGKALRDGYRQKVFLMTKIDGRSKKRSHADLPATRILGSIALNLPTSVVITGIDSMAILDQAFDAVDTFRPFSKEELQATLAKTA